MRKTMKSLMLKSILKAATLGLAAAAASTVWRSVMRQPAASSPPSRSPPHAAWPLSQLARLDHDLRTPIGTIGNAVEWLRTAPLDAESSEEAHAVIERQVQRLTTLTTELHELVAALEADPSPHDLQAPGFGSVKVAANSTRR